MNHQHGFVVIGLVMFIATLSSITLYAIHQQISSMIRQNQQYAEYLQQKQRALSALQWAQTVAWAPMEGQWQCQRFSRYRLRACLYQWGNRLLLRGQAESLAKLLPIYFYQWQRAKADQQQRIWLQPIRQGWSDVCPLMVACHE